MLRTASTNISIITNFGCRTNCWYCVWKNHHMKNVRLETDWNKLYDFLSENKDKGKVSVSGGGDCLYKFADHEDWWNKLFTICLSMGILIDVHSREVFYNKDFWKKINRVVISSDIPEEDESYISWVSRFTKVRIVHVVTAESTIETIKKYDKISHDLHCQLTLKELVGFDDAGNYEKFSKLFPNIFSLDQGDYNIYYMPDNTINTKFMG